MGTWNRTDKHFGEVLPGTFGLAVFTIAPESEADQIISVTTSCGCSMVKIEDVHTIVAVVSFGTVPMNQEYKIKTVVLKATLRGGAEQELRVTGKVCNYAGQDTIKY